MVALLFEKLDKRASTGETDMITNQSFIQISQQLNAAVNAVLKEHGLPVIQLGVQRYSDGSGIRINKADIMLPATATASMMTVASTASPALQRAMDLYNIASNRNVNGDELLDYKPNRPSYPFTYVGKRGGKWRCSVEQARARFGVKQAPMKAAG